MMTFPEESRIQASISPVTSEPGGSGGTTAVPVTVAIPATPLPPLSWPVTEHVAADMENPVQLRVFVASRYDTGKLMDTGPAGLVAVGGGVAVDPVPPVDPLLLPGN